MMIKDYRLAFEQLKEGSFWKPVIWSSIFSSLTFLIFLIVGISLGGILFDWLLSYFEFLDQNSWLRWIVQIIVVSLILLIGFFFYGSIHAAFLGLFIDQVIESIQEKYYPEVELLPAPTFVPSCIISIRFIILASLVNLLALPIYLIGWFFPPLGFALQVLVNGFLLGKEFKGIIKTRIQNPNTNHNQSYTLYGSLGALIWIIPFLNFFSPVLICAAIFHAEIRRLKKSI